MANRAAQHTMIWITLAFAAICILGPRVTPSLAQDGARTEEDHNGLVERVFLEVKQTVAPGRREIRIGWDGYSAKSILIVNLDYSVREQRRAEESDDDKSLHDVVLFRRMQAFGTATINIDESKLELN